MHVEIKERILPRSLGRKFLSKSAENTSPEIPKMVYNAKRYEYRII